MSKDRTKKKINELIDKLSYLFESQNLTKTISYAKEDEDEKAAAEIFYDEKYQLLELTIYPNFFEQKEDIQRKILLHEMCHTITIPLYYIFSDFLEGTRPTTKTEIREIMERSNSKIENIIDEFLKGNYKWAKETYANYLEKPMSCKKGKPRKKK